MEETGFVSGANMFVKAEAARYSKLAGMIHASVQTGSAVVHSSLMSYD